MSKPHKVSEGPVDTVVNYLGVQIQLNSQFEQQDQWFFEYKGRTRTAKSLFKARQAVDMLMLHQDEPEFTKQRVLISQSSYNYYAKDNFVPYNQYLKGLATSVTVDGDQVWVTVDGDSKTKKKYPTELVLLDNAENKMKLDLQESKQAELKQVQAELYMETEAIKGKYKDRLDGIQKDLNTQRPVSVKMFTEKVKIVAKELMKEVK